jgi:hypothetical protein
VTSVRQGFGFKVVADVVDTLLCWSQTYLSSTIAEIECLNADFCLEQVWSSALHQGCCLEPWELTFLPRSAVELWSLVIALSLTTKWFLRGINKIKLQWPNVVFHLHIIYWMFSFSITFPVLSHFQGTLPKETTWAKIFVLKFALRTQTRAWS